MGCGSVSSVIESTLLRVFVGETEIVMFFVPRIFTQFLFPQFVISNFQSVFHYF